MPTWPSSLRARLALWYTALLSVPLIVFALASYVVMSRALQQRTDYFIGDALNAFSREVTAERRAALTDIEAMRRTADEVRFRELQIAIFDNQGQLVAMSTLGDDDATAERRPSLDVGRHLVAELKSRDLSAPVTLTLASAAGAFRVVSRPLVVEGVRFSLTGTYSMADIETVLSRMRQMFFVAIPLLLVCAAFGGRLLAQRGLAPVASMASHAAHISVSNMHERLPVGGGDELVGLARVVNGLLDRLEHSFGQQRRFVADASHELRTPTAVVCSEADITLSREHRTEEEYRASVAIIQSAGRRITRIVDDLFLLARSDAGHLVMRAEPLYLEELVHDATRAVSSLAGQRDVRIVLGQVVEAPISGDADLLGRLLLNLLDNAIKYSPPSGTVSVDMRQTEHAFEVRVLDEGPGIPPDSHERVFERFFRVDNARSRAENSSTSGAGLGLAIARRIAEMHDGSVDIVESKPGRTVFAFSVAKRAGMEDEKAGIRSPS